MNVFHVEKYWKREYFQNILPIIGLFFLNGGKKLSLYNC